MIEFDRIFWSIFGFNVKLKKLIMFYVSSTKLSILWNGDKLCPFTPTRGLKQ